MNIELLEQVSNLSKKTEKVEVIAKFDQELADLVALALDQKTTFGITIDEDWTCDPTNVATGHVTPEGFWSDFADLTKVLSARTLTGNAAITKAYAVLSSAPDHLSVKWATRIINRNLRAGFDISSFNKARTDDKVKKFSIQLADTYEGEEMPGTWYVEPKLDGNRVVLLDSKGWSRNGKVYAQCQPVIDTFEKLDPKFFEKFVIDGEMMGNLGFDKSSGALRRIKDTKEATFTYWIFDVIDRDHWEEMNTDTFRTRRGLLEELGDKIAEAGVENVKVVPSIRVDNPTHAEAMSFCDKFVIDGFEGAMFKDGASPYVFKRGRNVLKVKKFHDIDLRVTSLYEGKGKHRGRLGGLVVDHLGVETKVGSGFNDALREEIWKNQESWVNATVQVQYQDIGSQGSLRFPVFIMRRIDKE